MSYQGSYADYLVKQARFERAVAHQPVDRVPCLYMAPAFAPRHMGMTQHKYCTDADAAIEVTLDSMRTLGDFDGINMMPSGLHPMHLTSLWLSKVLIPGIDLPENNLWQVRELEVMEPADYDFIVEQGWEAFVQKILPQVADMEMWQRHVAWLDQHFPGIAGRFHQAGYLVASAGLGTVPFEPMCGARSMSKFFLDLYRMPDRVKAAMDVAAPVITAAAIGAAKASGVAGVWLGGWRTASAMLAPEIWDKLVWPYFRSMAEALIAEGITPVFHWDQNWTRDLARLLEMPAKKCVLNPDGMTDVRQAKKLLRDHTAIMGDVPSPLFATGSPADVRKYVRDLVRDLGPEGLILCPGCDAPINTKVENMEAFLEASREFG
ncbi:MAG: methyltransferase [Deltaproteobacteria bacterium]|nr:methyltransferase [Deltaproteobacteria bacterium]